MENESAAAPVRRRHRRVSKGRAVFGDILIVLAVLLGVYLYVMMTRRIETVGFPDLYRSVLRRELVVCGVFLLLALDIRFKFFTIIPYAPLQFVGVLLRIAVAAASVVVLLLALRVDITGLVHSRAVQPDRVIVLGMALENGEPTRDLICRVDAAEAYGLEHPDARLYLTGGKTTPGAPSEAEVMRSLLRERGFPALRIRTETKATSTVENFRNVSRMIDPSAPVLVVTSNYHMARALRIAREAGFTAAKGLPARSDPLWYGVNVMWEVNAELSRLTNVATAYFSGLFG